MCKYFKEILILESISGGSTLKKKWKEPHLKLTLYTPLLGGKKAEIESGRLESGQKRVLTDITWSLVPADYRVIRAACKKGVEGNYGVSQGYKT